MLIVIDDYNKELYDQNNYLDKIINLAKKNKKRLLICIIGEGKYINKKQYQYFSNQDIDFSGLYWNLLIENDTYKQNGITEKFKKITLDSFFIK